MNKGLLELATYLNISDEQATISYDGINSSIIFGLLYNIPYNKVYTMTNITGSFIGYTHIKKQTDNCIYLSSNTTDWYKVGTDGTITTSGGCIISIRTFDFINSNLKINGINTLSENSINDAGITDVNTWSASKINSLTSPSIYLEGDYTIPANVPIGGRLQFIRITAYNGNGCRVYAPSGTTLNGYSGLSLFGQYSYLIVERINSTVFVLIDLMDKGSTSVANWVARVDGTLIQWGHVAAFTSGTSQTIVLPRSYYSSSFSLSGCVKPYSTWQSFLGYVVNSQSIVIRSAEGSGSNDYEWMTIGNW